MMLASIYRQEHVPFNGFRFYDTSLAPAVSISELLVDELHGIGIQRYLLDSLLIEKIHSSTAGIVAIGGDSVVREQPAGDFIIENDHGTFQSTYLVLATGAYSHLPQRLGVPTQERKKGLRCGVRIDLSHPPIPELPFSSERREVVKIFLEKDLQVCCTPITKDRLNLSCMTYHHNAALFKRKFLAQLVERVKAATNIVGEICDEPLGASHIGRFCRQPRIRNIFTIGDALRQLDPIGGMGMTQALITSRVTADTISPLLFGDVRVKRKALDTHESRLSKDLHTAKAFTHLSSWSLVNPTIRPVLGRLKTGQIARQALLNIHHTPTSFSPSSIISSLLVFCAGIL